MVDLVFSSSSFLFKVFSIFFYLDSLISFFSFISYLLGAVHTGGENPQGGLAEQP